MIQLKNIHKTFDGHEVLKGINLEIKTGETVVLLGLSGSGKTTTLKLINRLLLPDRGQVIFSGADLSTLNILEVRRKMGYVIQQGGLFPHYTVFDNIAMVPSLLNWPHQKIYTRVFQLLQKLHLTPEDFVNKYPDQLSGGQQQRVGVARALAADPPVLLMDEPLGALDPITRQSVRREFRELDELAEKTIVLVTHDIHEAFELADRIVLMHEGNIVQNDTPANILANPANNFVRSFLEADLLSLNLKNHGVYNKLNGLLASGKLKPEDLKKLTL